MRDYQMRFGKRCKPLKSYFSPRLKEYRKFPRRTNDTVVYVKRYFELNSFIKFSEVNYGFFTA